MRAERTEEVILGSRRGHQVKTLVADDGVEIYYRDWPCLNPQGVVIYLHGLGDHSGLAGALGDDLAAAGWKVVAPDQRGFGLSPGPRGDGPPFDRYLKDIDLVVQEVCQEYPDRKAFLLGLSLGGVMATAYAARGSGGAIAGIIALSPGFKARKIPLNHLTGMAWALLTNPAAPLFPVPYEYPQTTRDPEMIRLLSIDRLSVDRVSARLGWELLKGTRAAQAAARNVRVPVLYLVSANDLVVDVRATNAAFRRLGSADKTIRMYEDRYHNLVLEPGREELVKEISSWLGARAG